MTAPDVDLSGFERPSTPDAPLYAAGAPTYATQPLHPGGSPTQLVAPAGVSTRPMSYQEPPADRKKVSPGIIAGIVVGLIAAMALGAFIAVNVMAPQQEAQSASQQAQQQESTAATPESTQSGESSSSAEAPAPAAAPEPTPQEAAEQEARATAEASGMQILEGTLDVTTYATRAHEVAPQLSDFDSYDRPLAILLLDQPTDVSCLSAGGGDEPSTRTITSFSLHTDDLSYLSSIDGQHIAIAIDGNPQAVNRYWPSDVTGAIIDTGGLFTLLSPLPEGATGGLSGGSPNGQAAQPATPAPAPAPTVQDGDYVIADSATRAYTKSELETFDNYTLFLARNEIFARHGCGFKTPELRDWFGSKGWYRETIAPGSYGTEILNDVERSNVNTMLEIEKARNSPYI